MLTVLRSYSDAEFAFNDLLYVQADDAPGTWYLAGLYYDSTLGIYLWNIEAATLPSGTRNISDTIIGSTLWKKDATGSWHQMVMTQVDNPGGYVWTDYAQTSTQPTANRRVPRARAEDGINIIDVDGYQIHKMGITGGMWAELNQGTSLPL